MTVIIRVEVYRLARIVRVMVEPELLNNTLWDERDLTNSSCERVIFPETCVLCDQILKLAGYYCKSAVLS